MRMNNGARTRWIFAAVAVPLALVALVTGATPADAGAGNLCALAKRQGSVPARDTCVNALDTDVTGDGRADLVLLYDRTYPGPDGSVRFGPYTLKVIPAGGGVLESRVTSGVPPDVIVAAGRVNDESGVDLFIQVARSSSGSGIAIYSDRGGRLVHSGVTLTYGGDSASRFGFSCVRTPAPAIIQRSYELMGPGIGGRWRERIDTYRWQGPTLHRTEQQVDHPPRLAWLRRGGGGRALRPPSRRRVAIRDRPGRTSRPTEAIATFGWGCRKPSRP